jgi:hypothetical protein
VTRDASMGSTSRRSRLSDPRAIGTPLLIALITVVTFDSVLALGVFGSGPRGEVPLITRLLIGVIEATVLWGFLLLGRIAWLRPHLARRRPALTLATIIVGAQVSSRIATSALAERGLAEPGLGIGIDPTVFLTATTSVLIVLLSVLAEHREATAALRDATRRLRDALRDGERALRDERETLRLRVRDLLEARLGTTSRRRSTLTPVGLRELAERVLRPLSHQLADTSTGLEPAPQASTDRGGRRRTLRAMLALRPEPIVRPRLLAFSMLLLTFRASVRPPDPEQVVRDSDRLPAAAPAGLGIRIDVDWASLIASVLLHVITFLVVLHGARALTRFLEQHATPVSTFRARWTVTLGVLGMLGSGLFILLRVVHRLPGLSVLAPVSLDALLGFVAPLLLVTIVASLIEGAEDGLREARAAMTRTVDELAQAVARTNALLTHERRVFARRLHASVQAAVNAGSLILERALAEQDGAVDAVERVGRMIEGALLDLDRVDGEDGAAHDLAERLSVIADTWEDLCEVTVDLDVTIASRLERDPVGAATLGDLIAEACANAVVHGGAGTVAVTVRLEGPAQARLQVCDDGGATHPMRRDGLGTRTLEAHCTAWELASDGDGTTLIALLPIR